jgi:uncharacterized protein (TIGR02246 family)
MGHVARGRREITEGHRWLFGRMPGSRMPRGVKDDCDIRFLSPDVAVVIGRGAGVTEPGHQPGGDHDSVVSLVVVRTDTGWRFAHFQNTRVQTQPAT